MKTAVIRSSWMQGYGYRLDCSPYLGGGLEIKILLEQLPQRKDKLHTLTAGFEGGIYNGPHFSRTFVESPEYGVPFIGSSAMLHADLSDLPLLSKKQAESLKLSYLELKPGMSLISCSGTIGKMVYVRRDMAGMWSSQHIMKVVADPAKVPSGYLHAYLSSKFGIPLVASGTYGSIIQSIEPGHVMDLPVPRLGDALEHEIHVLVEDAAELRSKASEEINSTTDSLREFLNFPPHKNINVRGFGISSVSSVDLNWRLDATYHANAAVEADEILRRCPVPVRTLADADVTARLFKPPVFKRLWVEHPREGTQFVSGNDAYRLKSDDLRYVSFRTPNFEEFIVHEGWLIFQAAGQIYGLFARPLLVHGWLNGLFVADDMYRVVPNDPEDGGYLFAFFRTDVGQVLIKRESAGNSIPRVWDPQMIQIQVAWPAKQDRQRFGQQIIAAHKKMFQALQNDERAVALIECAIEGNG